MKYAGLILFHYDLEKKKGGGSYLTGLSFTRQKKSRVYSIEGINMTVCIYKNIEKKIQLEHRHQTRALSLGCERGFSSVYIAETHSFDAKIQTE